jgi:ribosomal protein S12 methylthiotransferase
MKKAKVGILSLGCPRNLVDSEAILGRLSLKGYLVDDILRADIAVINTCSFIEEAKRESIQALLDLVELKKQGRLKKVIVYGCLSQRYAKELRQEFPLVDAFVGKVSLNHETKRFPITPHHYAYLKICEGCINNCSFCIIPKIKGKFSSLDIRSLVKKAEALDKRGLGEINIIGQDITGYGIDLYDKFSLTELLKNILKKIKNAEWIRLLYLNPARISNELLELIRDESRICKYIDLPIQHINNRILRLMNRDSSKEGILDLIAKIRRIIPGVCLRTSVIVGFPSETDREFNELLRFIEEIKFERLGAFIYSREEQTPAYNFKKQISQKLKQERFNMIMSSQQRISTQINKRFVGSILDVLIEDYQGKAYLGRSQYDAPEVDGSVYVSSKKALAKGKFAKVKITDTLEYDLVGEVA